MGRWPSGWRWRRGGVWCRATGREVTPDVCPSRYTVPMAESKESLRRQLLEAREKVQAQIDKLRGLPSPLAGVGSAPFRGTAGAENDQLIAKLSETLSDIEDSLAELGDGT